MPQIGLHGMDLPDAAKRLEEICKLGPAHGHPDAVVTFGQGPHHMPAEKPRAAIYGDQSLVRAGRGHALSCFSPTWGAGAGQYRIGQRVYRAISPSLTSGKRLRIWSRQAQVAELVDALVSGTSGESRGGSSPLLGTNVPSLRA